MNWYLGVWKKFAEFGGRAQRAEYWYFVLFHIIIVIALGVIDNVLGLASGGTGALGGLYSLAVLIPGLAVGARRLHDTGRSGWWLLIGFIPLIGAIVLLVFLVQDSQGESNEYGANPKASAAA